MSQFLVLCLVLINAFVVSATARESSSNPAPHGPSLSPDLREAEAPLNRKLGKHWNKGVQSSVAPGLSPSEAHQVEENAHSKKETTSSDQAVSSEPKNQGRAEEEEIPHEKHHRWMEESVAGGGVILGGLAFAFLMAILCHIKATRRHERQVSA